MVARARAFVFPFDTAPAGFWLSPFGQGGVGWASLQGTQRFGPLWAVGASAGYTFLIAGRVLLALGLGGQYHVAEYPGWDSAPSFHRFYPTLDANLGYAF